ncbi:MAG TPA: chemotaxis response regulator protein-glutamate methylesterase [Alphaproteobacteria bacterium]|nr:chemotaxis response regulator protein-glutamate methylesterase [Alphaproteobacteria bacterium]
MPIKVLIVDDSLLIRQMFSKILSSDTEIEVVATAHDVVDAREKIKKYEPDVITLDIEMPGMDGITFLKKIMALRPTPVVMVSSLTQRGADITIAALEAGAVDYVPKTTSSEFDYNNLSLELIEKVKAASRVKIIRPKQDGEVAEKKKADKKNQYQFKNNILFAVGSSTGGVESLREVVTRLPSDFPPVLITQHMPPKFTKSFAERLDTICNMRVKEAENGDVIEVGNIYIAPGGFHMEVIKRGIQMACIVRDGEKVSGHIPSVDVLFESVAKNIGKNSYGVILTGMGKDGAKGLLQMKNAGSYNIGQDEASSIVYGMPKAAYLAGAVDVQVSLSDIADKMIEIAKQ